MPRNTRQQRAWKLGLPGLTVALAILSPLMAWVVMLSGSENRRGIINLRERMLQ